jgi:regulatory protein
MKITGIEKKSGTRYTLYVDGEYFYIFDLEILADYHVKEGMEVDDSFLQELKWKADERKAKERAFYLLSYRDHSEKELYDKLCKNVCAEIAAKTVAKMVELGLLNDENYAQKLARYYLEQKHWSYRKSLFEMKHKGISGELAEDALQSCEVSAYDQIMALVEQKYYRYLGDQKGNQKVMNALARLGFSYGDIRSVIQDYLEENDLGEEEEWQYE